MPTIQEMIETSKQKIAELGAAGLNIAKAPLGIAAGAMATPLAAAYDTATNAAKAVPKVALGAVGALTGLEAPKTPGFNYSTAEKTTGLIGSSISDAAKGFGVIGQNVKQGLKGVGFTEPVSASPTASTVSPVTPTAPSTVTPTVASTPPSTPINAVSRPEGDPNFFRGGATITEEDLDKYRAEEIAAGRRSPNDPMNKLSLGAMNNILRLDKEYNDRQARGVSGSQRGSFGSEQEYQDWKARGDLQNSSYYDGKNPNDDKFTGMMKELMDVSGSSPSAETSNKIKSLRLGIQALAPMTSYGQFGVAGLQTDTTKRGQDIGAETIRRGQDIGAETKASELALQAKDFETLARLRGATAAKSQAEADILNEQGKPDKVREKEVSGWLTERRKVKNAALEGMTDMTPEEQDKRIAALDALFVKSNPAPPRKAKQNADGTVTVEYADGRVVTGILKK